MNCPASRSAEIHAVLSYYLSHQDFVDNNHLTERRREAAGDAPQNRIALPASYMRKELLDPPHSGNQVNIGLAFVADEGFRAQIVAALRERSARL